MRFSAAIHPQLPLRKPAATEVLGRVGVPEPAQRRPPEAARNDELPVDLDQRVRLVGEW